LGETHNSFDITTRRLAGDVLAVVPSGELDLGSVGPLTDLLRDARARDQGVQLDLSKITFMDSTGLSLLIEVAQHARSNGWQLRMVDPSAPVARVIAMTRTQEALGIDASDGD
jgi:anti-anti-sigma factor